MRRRFALPEPLASLPLEEFATRLAARGPGLHWLDGGEGATSYLGVNPTDVVERAFGYADPYDFAPDIAPADGVDTAAGRAPLAIGYVSYDAAWSVAAPREHGLRAALRFPRTGLPVVHFARFDAALVVTPRERFIVADDEAAAARLEASLAEVAPRPRSRRGVRGLRVTPREDHASAIARALEAIGEGEIYQINLARRWEGELDLDPFALFLRMREASPVPLGFYADGGDFQVLGRSMETFLSWRPDARGRGPIVTRPIKGTRLRRGGADDAEAAALRADPKEHAEHAMIVDLMRNDLGHVAETGTVRVSRPFVVEPYRGLHHLVSSVEATTREGTDLRGVLGAMFPPGSVTGTPKSRAVELIEALEAGPRGVYCGAYGMIAGDGGVQLAVAIRTATVQGRQVLYQAGGGLVAASDASRELDETELKARVFTEAVRVHSEELPCGA